jgi:hypothetical protein
MRDGESDMTDRLVIAIAQRDPANAAISAASAALWNAPRDG